MRERQRLFCHAHGVIKLPELVTLENGSVEIALVDQAANNLPDPSATDLKTLLKAGVNLERVNCKLLSSTDMTPIQIGIPDPNAKSEQQTETESDKGEN